MCEGEETGLEQLREEAVDDGHFAAGRAPVEALGRAVR